MNIKDIARIAGVSPSTVSKIVNGKDDSISPGTRKKVLDVVRQYHYSPYSSSTPRTKSWIIGVLLRSSVSFDTTLDGIIQTAQAAGYCTLVFNSYSDIEQELKNITAVCKQKVDGIIWEPTSDQSLTYTSHLEIHDIPVLTIGPYGGDTSLLLPYEEAAYKVTLELIKRRHRDIGCLLTKGRRTENFLKGFRRCLFDHNMKFSQDTVFYDLNDALLNKVSTHAISGFVSSHYRMALEFDQLMNSMHHRIPADVSLISLQNDRNETLAYPGNVEISTYTVRNADFGSYLCGKLINTVEKRPQSPHSFVQEFHLDNTSTLQEPPEVRMKNIVVVGSISIDTYLSMPQLPQAGSTVSTRTSTTSPGGRGVNQAVGAARLGHRVALIGNVGADADSDYIYKTMGDYSIETTGIRRCAHTGTGKAFIFVDSRGESMISILSGANAVISPEDVRSKEQLFHNAGFCLVQTEIPMETVARACQYAHRYNAKTILKPSSCTLIPKQILRMVDILVPNERELDALCPGSGGIEDKASRLRDLGPLTVIVTLGQRGCYLLDACNDEYFPATGTKRMDDTGASDAFISALASYLLYGYPSDKAVQIANYAAEYGIAHEGVLPSLIDRNTLENRIRAIQPDLLDK